MSTRGDLGLKIKDGRFTKQNVVYHRLSLALTLTPQHFILCFAGGFVKRLKVIFGVGVISLAVSLYVPSKMDNPSMPTKSLTVVWVVVSLAVAGIAGVKLTRRSLDALDTSTRAGTK